MKRRRYSDDQIAFALRQPEAGTSVEEICRKLRVSEPTFYRWKKQFASMGVAEIRRLRQLEEAEAEPCAKAAYARRTGAEGGEVRRLGVMSHLRVAYQASER